MHKDQFKYHNTIQQSVARYGLSIKGCSTPILSRHQSATPQLALCPNSLLCYIPTPLPPHLSSMIVTTSITTGWHKLFFFRQLYRHPHIHNCTCITVRLMTAFPSSQSEQRELSSRPQSHLSWPLNGLTSIAEDCEVWNHRLAIITVKCCCSWTAKCVVTIQYLCCKK